jgi:homoserine O-acetyltransferase
MFPIQDPNNLLCMLDTWQTGDCSANDIYKSDFKASMVAIKSKIVVMPGSSDLYFPVEDNRDEVEIIGDNAKLQIINSDWGHWAGGPGTSVKDKEFIDGVLKKLFAGGQ